MGQLKYKWIKMTYPHIPQNDKYVFLTLKHHMMENTLEMNSEKFMIFKSIFR